MQTLVDTNVLIDIAVRDPAWYDWSRARMIERLGGGLSINPVIFSEFCFRYESLEEAEAALDPREFRREHLPWEAAFAAGRAYSVYRARGGGRDRTLPDFLIGGHAVVRGYAILTRDPVRYRTYFPTVDIIAPDSHP